MINSVFQVEVECIMEPTLYFLLQVDSVASKLEKGSTYSTVYVTSGSVWVCRDDGPLLSSPQTLRLRGQPQQQQQQPQQPQSLPAGVNGRGSAGPGASSATGPRQMTVSSFENQDVVLTCSSHSLIQLDETEANLLVAVSVDDRQRVFRETSLLRDGCQILQRWKDQFRVPHRNGAADDICVYVLGQKDMPDRAAGVIQYVGPLPSHRGIWFGVKLVSKFHGLGSTDGYFRGKQFFQCPPDSGVFVPVSKICPCFDHSDFDETYDVVQHKARPAESAVADRNGDGTCGRGEGGVGGNLKNASLWNNDQEENIPRPPLQIGDRVVWISDYGPEPGTVKWIGILPDCRVKEYTIGVEFDRPIGTGTGKYNNDQLFRTAQNHASLIPVLGLMKAEEFYGSAEAIPQSPFISGSVMTKRSGSNVKCAPYSQQEYGCRHDTPSPLGPKVDFPTSQVCSNKGKDTKPVIDVDQISDTLCQSAEELRTCYTRQYSKTMPRSGKSTAATSYSDTESVLTTLSKLSDHTTKAPPPIPQEKPNPDTEKSIYDKEPEHYYENVEKDATGRLLNRDTNAFRMIESGVENLANVRSNSGEDLSAAVRSVHADDSSAVAIYRSSRSVDNIFSDEKILQANNEQFTMQLPYRTGRSVFYERLGNATALPNGKTLKEKEKQSDIPSSKKLESVKANSNQESSQKQSTFVSPRSSPSHGGNDVQSSHVSNNKTVPKNVRRLLHGSFDSQQKDDQRVSVVNHGNELVSLSSNWKSNCEAPNAVSGAGALPVTAGPTLHGTVGSQGLTSMSRTGSMQGTSGNNSISPDENLIPKTLSRMELDTDLDIGSMVEVEIGRNIHYGVMKWLGFLNDRREPLAGIELEEEFNGATDGKLGKTRLFDCPPKKGYFVPLCSVQRDGRFAESSQFVNRTASQMFGSMECIDIAGCLPALSLSFLTSNYTGLNKGIQGHHNSCYMDATLFSMFAFTMVFDSILYRPRQSEDITQYDDIQVSLREGIVNPLRSNFYVRADKVLRLRTLLDHCSTIQGLIGEEKDPEEFLSSLLQQTLKADPLIHLSSGQESYLFQLFISEKDDAILLPTTQQLLELSFLQSDIKLSEIPSCLILQMPRFGKDYKMFRRIVPSLYLDITDILQFGIRECTICGSLANNECKNCYQHFGDSLDKIAFCDICLSKSHKNPKRSKHQPSKIKVNEGYAHFTKECRSDGDTGAEAVRERMELFAVVCIETSHYVAFVKCGPGPRAPWVFFDSMADRKGAEHGYNIPCVKSCEFLPQLLQDASYSTIHKYRDEKDLPDQMRRLLCDGYMCFYQSTSLAQYR